MSLPLLFERAGVVSVGDNVGGIYQPDYSLAINRVQVTALASPVAATVFDLLIGGALSGYQVSLPSGVPNTEVSAMADFNPPVSVLIQPSTGYTPQLRWQCISGSNSVVTAASQVDLLMWVERLSATPPNIIPFSGGLLTSPALNEGDTEGQAQALFKEWLGGYFDGNTHPIGINASGVFPMALIKFEQGEIRQPLQPTPQTTVESGLEIRLVMNRRQEVRTQWPVPAAGATGTLMQAPATLNFQVRAKQQGRGQGPYLVRSAAGLLYSILNNPANCQALNEKGIKHLMPKGGVTIPSRDWSEQLVSCQASLEWIVYYED